MSSLVTTTKILCAIEQALIDAYVRKNGISRCASAVAKGAKQPRTKHMGKPNYGMKARRYA
jgi:hypothetical protein